MSMPKGNIRLKKPQDVRCLLARVIKLIDARRATNH